MATYDYYTLEYKSETRIVAYGWGTYGPSSVLAGQSKKVFLESFEDEEEAKKAYPTAQWSSHWTEPANTFNHLPDDGDY